VPNLRAFFEARSTQWILGVGAVLGVLIGLDTLLLHLRLDPLSDVRAYYDAGARLNAGLPLYEQPAGTDDSGFYRYPPLLAIVFRPLALLPFETAALIWEAVLLGLFVLTIVRMGLRDRWTWLILGWLAAPIAWSLAIGQAQVAVTFLMALGAPWALAFAAHLKLLPALAAIYWVGRRDWQALGRFVAWGVALAVVSFVLEPNGTLAFIGFADLEQVGAVQNLSLYAISPVLWVVSLLALAVIALRLAPTRYGWIAAVALSVFASPRLLMYQVSTLMAAKPLPDDAREMRE
jgi:hypothetical protein